MKKVLYPPGLVTNTALVFDTFLHKKVKVSHSLVAIMGQ